MLLRPTVRLRLTALYALVFLVSGAALVLMATNLVEHRLETPAVRFTEGEDNRNAGLAIPLAAGEVRQVVYIDGKRLETQDPLEAEQLVANANAAFRARAVATLVGQALLALAIVTVVSVILGWTTATRILRPLQRITDTAQRLTRDNFGQRIPTDGPDDELRRLASTFNGMLDRLQIAFDAERRFAAHASQALRSPLADLRSSLEAGLGDRSAAAEGLRASAASSLSEVERLDVLCDRLLQLACASEAPVARRPVDLAALTTTALKDLQERRHAGDEPLDVGADLRSAAVTGDPVLLESVVENIVENAMQHNVPGGWVEVLTRVDGTTASLRVRNSGPEIAEDKVDELFEPFHRRLRARVDSAGLGLSIARTVVQRHGGALKARALRGGGLEVVVALPGAGAA